LNKVLNKIGVVQMIKLIKKYKIGIILVLSILIVFILWFTNYNSKMEGSFGDKFGAVNALFSGLAFAGIIITVYMQKEELSLQRKELKSTRKVFKKQSNIMAQQQNDNTFFNLLTNHRQLVESLRTGNKRRVGERRGIVLNPDYVTDTVSGYEVLDNIIDDFIEYFTKYSSAFNDKLILEERIIKENPINYVSRVDEVFLHFNELIHLLQFINEKFEINEQEFYKNTLWNNLTSTEKLSFEMIYFNYEHLRKDVFHKTKMYQFHKFVNFEKDLLPLINVNFNNINENSDEIKIDYDCELMFANFIIYKRNSFDNGEMKNFDRINIPFSIDDQKLDIDINKFLNESSLNIENGIFENSNELHDNYYCFQLKLKKNNKTFDYIQGFELSNARSNSKYDSSNSFYARLGNRKTVNKEYAQSISHLSWSRESKN